MSREIDMEELEGILKGIVRISSSDEEINERDWDNLNNYFGKKRIQELINAGYAPRDLKNIINSPHINELYSEQQRRLLIIRLFAAKRRKKEDDVKSFVPFSFITPKKIKKDNLSYSLPEKEEVTKIIKYPEVKWINYPKEVGGYTPEPQIEHYIIPRLRVNETDVKTPNRNFVVVGKGGIIGIVTNQIKKESEIEQKFKGNFKLIYAFMNFDKTIGSEKRASSIRKVSKNFSTRAGAEEFLREQRKKLMGGYDIYFSKIKEWNEQKKEYE